jgi:hypothetical protein
MKINLNLGCTKTQYDTAALVSLIRMANADRAALDIWLDSTQSRRLYSGLRDDFFWQMKPGFQRDYLSPLDYELAIEKAGLPNKPTQGNQPLLEIVFNSSTATSSPKTIIPTMPLLWSIDLLPNDIMRTVEWNVYFPTLYLLAKKLTQQRRKDYSLEMAADELYASGIVPEHKPLTPFPFNRELCIETINVQEYPETESVFGIANAKYQSRYEKYSGSPTGASVMRYKILNNSSGKSLVVPLCFAVYKGTTSPISFIGVPSSTLYPFGLEHIDDVKQPIVVTEYMDLFDANQGNAYVRIVTWAGGQKALKSTDFSGLVGRSITYYLCRADGENNLKRAAGVALDFISQMKKAGYCHITVWDSENNKDYKEQDIAIFAHDFGLELPDNLEDAPELNVHIPWKDKSGIAGQPLVGDHILEAGRKTLLVAGTGVGKSLFSQLLANVACRGESLADDPVGVFKFQAQHLCKVLFLQNEMAEGTNGSNEATGDFAERQKRINRLFTKPMPSDGINYFKPAEDLSKKEGQLSVVNKLVELDPPGKEQWILIMDNLKSLMPSATQATDYNKVKTWFRELNGKGICILLIHHANKQGESYGTSNITEDAEWSYFLSKKDETLLDLLEGIPDEISKEMAERIKLQEAKQLIEERTSPKRCAYLCWGNKDRHGMVNSCSIRLEWIITDQVQTMQTQRNDYKEIEDAVQGRLNEIGINLPQKETPKPETKAAPVPVAENTPQSVVEELPCPDTWKALDGLDEATQTKVLLELRSKKTVEKIAEELHCSPRTITNRCKELRISDEDVKKYAAEKSKVNGGTVR